MIQFSSVRKVMSFALAILTVVAFCTTCNAQEDDDPDCVAALREIGVFLRSDDDGNIIRVSFAGPSITDEQIAPLRGLHSVRMLQFEGAHITDAAFAHCAHLSELRILSISNRWLQTQEDGTISFAFEDRLDITGSGLVHIQEIPLTCLRISGTKINDDSLDAIIDLSHLRQIYLLGNEITQEGFRHLREAFPRETDIPSRAGGSLAIP